MKPKSSKPTKEIDALTLEEEERFIQELDKGYDDYTIVFYISIYICRNENKWNISFEKRRYRFRK